MASPDRVADDVALASPAGAATWRFAEGNRSGTWFDTYFAVANVSASGTTATFTIRTQANTTVTSTLYVPAGGRATLYANAVAGLLTQAFQTTVTASQPLVVERAMYWPGTSGSSLMAGGELSAFVPEALPVGAAIIPGSDESPLDPATEAERAGSRPYTVSAVEAVGIVSLARAAGAVSAEEQDVLDRVATARAAFLAKAPPGTQSGVAPPVRLGGTTALTGPGTLDANTSGATTLSIALPWTGGHLTLGRRQ